MNRRQLGHIIALVVVGALVRGAAAETTGIWRDFGFWAYDAGLILRGQTPFVDFLGRSPLYVAGLAVWRGVVGTSPLALRAFENTLWMLTGLPVYALGREAADHQTGLVALGGFLLLPFGVIYSQWVNSQGGAALLVTTAVFVVVARDGPRWYALVGGLLGAAFLTRQSAVVVVGSVGLVLVVDCWRGRETIGGAAARGVATVGAWGVTLLVGYAAVVGLDPARTLALAEVHAVNLFLSTGRGGWPQLGATVTPGNTIPDGRIPVLNDVCQLCGRWTARTLAKGLLVALPAVGLTVGPALRYATARWFEERLVPILFAPLAVLTVYAAAVAVLNGYLVRVGALLALAGLVAVAYRADLPESLPRLTAQRAMLVPVLVASSFAAGYLYRERLLHVNYAMDLWPMACVLLGVSVVTLWRRLDRPSRAVLVALLVVAVVTSTAAANPLSAALSDDDWFTDERVADYRSDINARTDRGDVVLAQTATYLVGTGARMPLDDSRSTGHIFSELSTRPNSPPMKRLYAQLRSGMADGSVALVITDEIVWRIIAFDETTSQQFEANYCRVNDAGTQALYGQTGATLWAYNTDCPADRRPTVEGRAPS